MKLIHCADLHLDSSMRKNLSPQQAGIRKNELLLTFERMVEYGKKEGIKIILIAGDLFDGKKVSRKTAQAVLQAIQTAPEIDFLYLKGNHDDDYFFSPMEEAPENLKLFGEEWISYRYGRLVITGIELNQRNSTTAYESLKLNPEDTNIVMMHGQESEYPDRNKAEMIYLASLKQKNIDYLALGHLHSYKCGILDERGCYCYSGCLEGRGFDECGEKGFVLLSWEEGNIKNTFLPFASRKIMELAIDITGRLKTTEADQIIQSEVKDYPRESMIKIILTGKVPLEAEFNLDYLTAKYGERFFGFKIKDESELQIEFEQYKNDASLKGEFIRLVLSEDISEKERRQIIESGLKALAGEEIT